MLAAFLALIAAGAALAGCTGAPPVHNCGGTIAPLEVDLINDLPRPVQLRLRVEDAAGASLHDATHHLAANANASVENITANAGTYKVMVDFGNEANATYEANVGLCYLAVTAVVSELQANASVYIVQGRA